MSRRLYSPKYTKEILEKYQFQFSKSLGQNFLIDGNILNNIMTLGGITKEDLILEIGPGIGTLTEEIALNAKKVVAVELDKNLLPILDQTLKVYDNIEIVHGDILEINVKKLIEDKLDGGPIKVVANLPYYITTPIIGKLLESELNIHSIIIMVQKEVADRMVARCNTKDYGSLSVFINYYTDAEIILKVPKTVFMPQPKVDSAVVKMVLKEELPNVNRELFFKIVKSAFGKRRKTILNSLSSGELNVEKEMIKNILEEANIPLNARAENLNIEDFIKISETFSPLDIY
ncbi:MAG: 16S rRNA (adenine(1518)-N(6)/adenine(1519)-N(6))-dimethyltransferase RsmA [Tissierellia bacterium]|nr:16S rRNA (adenine(1518)-N(6)/adenine(1519)-N(6))-dimethyltransferase RsmA [Tissierellia bacterium]